MGESESITYSFSYVPRVSIREMPSTIHLIFRRPTTQQSDVSIQMPSPINGTGPTPASLRSNIQFLLIYHDISDAEATRISHHFLCFVHSVQMSAEGQGGGPIDIYLVVTDTRAQSTNRLDTDIFVTDLQTARRAAKHEEGDEDCSICLETFKERTDLTDLGCTHKFHFQCIVTWLYSRQSCPICRAAVL